MDWAAAVAALAWVLYHYLTNRDVRRTLHRIADALAAQPAQQDRDVASGDQHQDQPPG